MKFLKRLFASLLIFLAILITLAYVFDVTYLFKAVRTIYFKGHTTAFLEDYKAFDNETINASSQPIAWPVHSQYNTATASEKLLETHENYGTIAYLVFKNDSLFYEAYYDGFNKTSKTNSFSIAKTFVSAMLGKAIMEGYIESLDQPLGDFIPKFKNDKTTVGDLASMASGLDWDESYYSPFSITTKAYFYHDLRKMMLELDIVDPPGEEFNYLSGSTQLLAMAIEKATGKSLPSYFEESFWQPLGAENKALWQVDSKDKQMTKAYCCFASNARDFARFGKLYNNQGNFFGNQILDSTFVKTSIEPRFKNDPYGYGVWLGTFQEKPFYVLRGHLGQYIIGVPEDQVIVVRLGHQKGPENNASEFSDNFWTYLKEAYKLLEQKK